MKKILLLLFLCSPAFATIAYTGNSGSQVGTSGALTATVTINSGDTVVVSSCLGTGTARTVSSVVDSSGANTYTQKAFGSNSTAPQCFLWGSLNVANAATTVTITFSGAYSRAAVVAGTYIGVSSFGNATNSTTGTSLTLSVAVTTQDANNFVVMGGGQNSGSAAIAFTASTGNLRVQATSADGFMAALINDNTAASASSVTNTVTSNKNNTWAVPVVELRSGTAAAAPTQVSPIMISSGRVW